MASVDFTKLPGWLDLVRRARDVGLTEAARTHSNIVRAGFSKVGRWSASAPGTPPNIRRGILRGGVTYTEGRNGAAYSGVRRGIPYARIQETGGVIRAKRGFLPVPINEKAARISEKNIGGLRREPGLLVLRRRGRAPMIVSEAALRRSKGRLKDGARGGVYSALKTGPAWVLVRRVFLRPRPYLVPRMKDPRITRNAIDASRRYIKSAVNLAGGGR